MILRFTIADINEEGLSAKEGLLLWTQKRTVPYRDDFVIKDFTVSWKSGLALYKFLNTSLIQSCALIHRHRPDLLDYMSLNKSDAKTNMNLAFDIAEEHLGIPKLFAAEDILNVEKVLQIHHQLLTCDKPDERSIMTYAAQYFHAFSALGI